MKNYFKMVLVVILIALGSQNAFCREKESEISQKPYMKSERTSSNLGSKGSSVRAVASQKRIREDLKNESQDEQDLRKKSEAEMNRENEGTEMMDKDLYAEMRQRQEANQKAYETEKKTHDEAMEPISRLDH